MRWYGHSRSQLLIGRPERETLAAGALCKVAVNVTGTASGVLTNSVQANSIEGLTGNTSICNLNVASPPSIVKTFGADRNSAEQHHFADFQYHSPTVATLTGIAFTDTLPAGLAVATSNGLSSTCGGTTAMAGSGAVSLIGGTLAPVPIHGLRERYGYGCRSKKQQRTSHFD